MFLFLNLSEQFPVRTAAFAFILNTVFNNAGDVPEQTERGNRRRPVSVDTNAVDELCCVLIAMLGGKMKIVHCRIGVSWYVFSVKINFAELVFGIVVAVFGGNLKAADGFLNVLDLILGQIYLACKVRCIGIFLCGGTVKPTDSLPDIFRYDLAFVQQPAEDKLCRSKVL